MSTEAILAVSFGTTHDDAREKNITAVEKSLAESFPGCTVESAFTSGMVLRALAKRGEAAADVGAALESLNARGFKRVLVQPTHIIYGVEYEKLRREAEAKAMLFEELKIGRPLLACTEDMRAAAKAIAGELSLSQGECLVMIGHGTSGSVNTVYAAMEYMFRDLEHENIFVGTVEAWPDMPCVLKRVKQAGFLKVLLAPMMLVAGDHAKNDIAGDGEGSWKSVFSAHGLETKALIKGLGEYEGIRRLYCEHAAKDFKN